MGATTSRNQEAMVDLLVRRGSITDINVEIAYRLTDRARFLPEDQLAQAYRNNPIKLTSDRNGKFWPGPLHLSAPDVYARVLCDLQFEPGQSFLNIGSGTGWLSTAAGFLIGENGLNIGVEIYQNMVDFAEEKIEECSDLPEFNIFPWARPQFYCLNALSLDFLANGTEQFYDRIYVGAAIDTRKQLDFFLKKLKIGGRLIAPVTIPETHRERLYRYVRISSSRVVKTALSDTVFAALIKTIEPKNTVPVEENRIHPLKHLCKTVIRQNIRNAIESRGKKINVRQIYTTDGEKDDSDEFDTEDPSLLPERVPLPRVSRQQLAQEQRRQGFHADEARFPMRRNRERERQEVQHRRRRIMQNWNEFHAIFAHGQMMVENHLANMGAGIRHDVVERREERAREREEEEQGLDTTNMLEILDDPRPRPIEVNMMIEQARWALGDFGSSSEEDDEEEEESGDDEGGNDDDDNDDDNNDGRVRETSRTRPVPRHNQRRAARRYLRMAWNREAQPVEQVVRRRRQRNNPNDGQPEEVEEVDATYHINRRTEQHRQLLMAELENTRGRVDQLAALSPETIRRRGEMEAATATLRQRVREAERVEAMLIQESARAIAERRAAGRRVPGNNRAIARAIRRRVRERTSARLGVPVRSRDEEFEATVAGIRGTLSVRSLEAPVTEAAGPAPPPTAGESSTTPFMTRITGMTTELERTMERGGLRRTMRRGVMPPRVLTSREREALDGSSSSSSTAQQPAVSSNASASSSSSSSATTSTQTGTDLQQPTGTQEPFDRLDQHEAHMYRERKRRQAQDEKQAKRAKLMRNEMQLYMEMFDSIIETFDIPPHLIDYLKTP